MSAAPPTPALSIIVPCFNEERTIGLLLEAIASQTFPVQQMEVVIADGLSTDRTREAIRSFQTAKPALAIQVVDNSARNIPAALNTAIRHSRGEIIIRLDAHCVPYPDYVERCVNALQAGQGENVGGVWEIRPFALPGQKASAVARSIAAAASHPLGVGDAYYRFTTQAQTADTVPFGAFRRALVEKVGGFDETLLTNEDYEFNARVLQSGGVVWLDPAIRTVYFARPTLRSLARQYWRYGFWKFRMLQRYPHTLRWRQALPPVFVATAAVLGLLSPWLVWARVLLAVQILAYSIILLGASIPLALKYRDPFMILGLPLAITGMHFSWGAGFLASAIGSVRKSGKQG